MSTSAYPSLPPSFLHPHHPHSLPSYHSNSHYMPQPPFTHSHSGGSMTNQTSPSSSSVEPVTPELSANMAINLTPDLSAKEKDRRVSNASQVSNEEMIDCKWADCDQSFSTPDKLYDHLCNNHVGRKSTGNLNLTCGWEGCGVKCVKRDHITSHLRVHTPLKPHPCSVCGKTFKRPQDLKKHERIHTQEHHALHKLSKATTSSDPAFNQRVAAVPTSFPSSAPTATEHVSHERQNVEQAKSASPTPSALALLHKKQHEELAAFQQREMAMLQQLAFQQQQTQAYAAQFAQEGMNKPPKRSTDDAFGDLWADMKKRKVEPVYNGDMISRLNDMVPPTFGHSSSMSGPSFSAPSHSMHNPYTQYANYGSSAPGPHSSYHSAPSSAPAPNLGGGGGGDSDADALSFPEIKTDADLAMFNQFMISLGRDAATAPPMPQYNTVPMTHSGSFNSGFSSSSINSGSPLSDSSPIEDLFNPEELASLGLAGIPGIPMLPPASLPQNISFGNMYPSLDATRSRAASNPDLAMNDFTKRAIAGLPRNHSLSHTPPNAFSNPSTLNFPSYPELSTGHAFKPSSSELFDFDSLARSKPGIASTIQPRDFHKKTYRHVAPLGAAVSSRGMINRVNESSLRTELDLEADDDEERDEDERLADSPEQMDTPKISIRSLLTSDDLPDGPDLVLPKIHSPTDEEEQHEHLPSVRELEGYRPPVKRHTEEDMVRAVKRLELDGPSRRNSVVEAEAEMEGQRRRKHAALIRAWLVAVNLEYRARRLGEVEKRMDEDQEA